MNVQRRPGLLCLIDQLFRTGTAAGLSDEQLLERFATRHDEAAEAAFATLMERHGPMVLSVCRRVLTDPHDALDAFQATFLVLIHKAGSVRKRRSLASWLFGVAWRVSARTRGAATRRREVERSARAEMSLPPKQQPPAARSGRRLTGYPKPFAQRLCSATWKG